MLNEPTSTGKGHTVSLPILPQMRQIPQASGESAPRTTASSRWSAESVFKYFCKNLANPKVRPGLWSSVSSSVKYGNGLVAFRSLLVLK